jgi:ABC-type antimicrobial peptide transport system permease subunit
MIRNYLAVAWRNLWKNKSFSAINIFGLALGITCSLLILLWVRDEYSVDGFHKNGNRLYSVYQVTTFDGKVEGGHYTPGPMPDEMKRVLPEVVHACGFAWNSWNTFAAGEKIMKVEGNAAGADFFTMFSYPLLEGSAATALSTPTSIAISKTMASNFFGSPKEAIGKTLRFENYRDLQVTAVFEDIPHNSSQRFKYLLSWDFFLERNDWAKNWGNNGPFTFLQLRPDADAAKLEANIKKFLDKYVTDIPKGFSMQLGLQRYDDMYLHSQIKEGHIQGGRIEYVRLFSVVAIFILLIACINFMNLTTARSVKRAREIGVRKVVGAIRPVLVRQFIGEALLITFIATAIAILLMVLLLPVFNEVTAKRISLPLNEPYFWACLLGIMLLTGFISGSYPALLLSSFNPVAVLKGKLKPGSSAVWFRKGLVVFQFVLSIILITGMIVITRQVNYMQNVNLGFNKQNLIYMPIEGELITKYNVFKEEASRLPGIAGVTQMSNRPTHIQNGTGGINWPGKDPNVTIMFTQASVGYDFVKNLQLTLLQGRDFSKEFADSSSYIINETALAKIGYKDPIGQPIEQWGRKGKIVGVLKDFHFNSFHTPIQPLILRLGENRGSGYMIIRTEAGKTPVALAGLEKLAKQINPRFPFAHQFADEEWALLYEKEKVIEKLSNYFAFLGIFISCLGLLGLVMFTAGQRAREISIRKVLGAGTGSLFTLLSKDFVWLVGIAMVIASPVAWWAMHNWLQNFHYRIQIHWSIFGIAGIAAIIIALGTISFQAIKAAVANPIKSLRTE